MNLFSSPTFLIGIEFSSTLLKIAILKHKKGIFQIEELQQIPYDKENVNPLYKKIPTKKLHQGILCSALEGKEVLIRQIELPLTKESDILSALDFQVEPLIPYSIDQSIIQHQKTFSNKTHSQVTIFSVKKEKVDQHLKGLSAFYDSEIVSCYPIALCNLFKHYFYHPETHFILHYGLNQATLIFVENGKLLASRSIDVQNYPLEKDFFYKELCKAIYSIEASYKQKATKSLILLGTSLKDSGVQEKIAEITDRKPLYALPNSMHCSEHQLHEFALPMGIALCGLSEEVNFRRKEYSYPKPWKREKKPLLIYFVLSILISLGVVYLSSSLQTDRLKRLNYRYLELLSQEGRNVEEQTKNSLSSNELQIHLDQLENEIRLKPETFALNPGIPKVSDLLAWISTHPQISASIDTKDAPIHIEGFHYTMAKRPDPQHKKDHYQVKIDLEFTAINPSVARALHDALLSPNPIVDSKHEVQWNSTKGKYKASFYLKDKTRYN